MEHPPLRVAHLSDLHFAHASLSFKQFFSKRWLGNLNLLLFRGKTMKTTPLALIPPLLKKLHLDAVLITGDVATTSLPQEFAAAKAFVETLKELSLPVHLVPGNHDVYTKGSDKKKRFYTYFPGKGKKSRVEARQLKKGWWWVGLDTAHATPLWLSSGTFFPTMQKALEDTLKKLPKEDKIIVANHFPLYGTKHPRHDLNGRLELQNLLKKYPAVVLYLHGHDHLAYTIDRTKEGFPLVSNSGSCADAPTRTFSCIELTDQEIIIDRYIFNASWQWDKKERYTLR